MSSRIGTFGAAAVLAAALWAGAGHAAGENHATFGSRWWTQTAPEATYREYVDLSRGGYLESFLVREWNADNALVLSGENALRGDQSTRLALARGVRWRLEVRNDQIPHLFSPVTRSLYTETSPGVFRLPDSLQARNQSFPGNYGTIMSDALRHASRVEAGFRTEISTVRLRSRPAPGWRFELNGERRDRSGYKAIGAPFGFSTAIEMLEPIQQQTRTGSATATYQRGAAKVAATVGLSTFRNRVGELVWDNPKRLTDRSASADDASSQGQLDLAPDNRLVSGQVALGYRLPRRTTFSATVGASQGTQDDAFLPFTINSAIAQRSLDSLPARSLDGKRVSVRQDYRLTTRAWPGVSGTLRFHSSHVDNQTPELSFIGGVRGDQSFSRGERKNHPYGHTHSVLGADLDFRVAGPLGVGVLVERRTRDRTFREIEKDDENVFGAHASADLTDDLSLSANVRVAERTLDAFHDSDYKNAAGVFIEQPKLRRFDVANRKQTAGGADVSWQPVRWFGVDAQYGYQLNDFPDSRYGLGREEQHLVVTEATLRPRPRVALSGGYGFGQAETEQNSNETNASAPPTDDAATDWTATIKDRNVYVFGNAEWWAIERRLAFTAAYEFTRALGDYRFRLTPSVSLPTTLYRRHDAQLGARWRLQHSTEIGGRWSYEEYDVTDVLNENIPLLQFTGTSATAIYLGDSHQDYRAHRLEVLATRRF